MRTSELWRQRASIWIMASRPRTLTAAATPVIVGAALAIKDQKFSFWAVLTAFLVAMLIQIGTNLANDLHDFKKGADTPLRTGPTRVTSAGLLLPQQVETGTYAAFGLAALLGLYLVYLGGWPILLIGITSIAAGIAYTAGPFPLGYNGLGDLAVFIFFGLAGVIGMYYVQAQSVTATVILAAIPVGALTTNIIVVNNIRDVDTDRKAGKRTLAVLLGIKAAQLEYAILAIVAYIIPYVIYVYKSASIWVFLPLVTFPFVLSLLQKLIKHKGRELNRVLAGSATLLVQYGLLFSLGLNL